LSALISYYDLNLSSSIYKILDSKYCGIMDVINSEEEESSQYSEDWKSINQRYDNSSFHHKAGIEPEHHIQTISSDSTSKNVSKCFKK